MRILTFLILVGLCYQSFSAQFNYKVMCQTPQDCPQWFAGLVHHSGVCSSFLVKSNVIATNYHCLPPQLTQEGANCENAIEFIFPGTAEHPEERVGCDRVLYLSPPLGKEVLKPDFAFIRLKSNPARRPVEIAQTGFPDLTYVTMYKMDPNKETNTGYVRRAECRAVQNSIINPYFTTNTAPLILLTGCPIIKGNSGSPLLVNGVVHGIVSATMELITPALLKSKIGGMPKLNFGFGSNFACLSNPDLGFFMEKVVDCEIAIDPETQKKRSDALISKRLDKALDELQEKVNNSARKDLLAGKPLLLWKAKDEKPANPVKDDYLLKVTFAPHCLLPKTPDINVYASRLSSKNVSMPQQVPEYLVSEKLDQFLRYDVKLRETTRTIPLSLIPKDLVKRRDIQINFDQKPMSIHLCSELVASAKQK